MIEHLEVERLFLTNSRSKAGFLVSACEKAKRGELDARGFGALDPWRSQMKASCVPRPVINLLPESEWISKQPSPIKLSITNEATKHSISINLTDSIADVKQQYYELLTSPSFSISRLKLTHPGYGSLRDDRTPAFYNLSDNEPLTVKLKNRGGRKVNRHF